MSFIPNDMRVNIVRVTSYNEQNFEGTLENPYVGEPADFHNLTQLLLTLEQMADEMNCPRRSSEKRSLTRDAISEGGCPAEDSDNRSSKKTMATFKIIIMFRQHSSWQGRCEWSEQRKTADFRSALELVQLMDGVLTSVNKK